MRIFANEQIAKFTTRASAILCEFVECTAKRDSANWTKSDFLSTRLLLSPNAEIIRFWIDNLKTKEFKHHQYALNSEKWWRSFYIISQIKCKNKSRRFLSSLSVKSSFGREMRATVWQKFRFVEHYVWKTTAPKLVFYIRFLFLVQCCSVAVFLQKFVRNCLHCEVGQLADRMICGVAIHSWTRLFLV